MAHLEFLATVPAFASLAEVDLRRLSSQCEWAACQSGAQVIHFGAEGDAMFVIISGEARVIVPYPDGDAPRDVRLGPREIFGEMALLTGETRSADVYAETRLEMLVIRREPLQAFLHAHTGVAGFLTDILGRRLLADGRIRHVGGYVLGDEIGRGGVGRVFRAVHAGDGRVVAVKMLSHDLVYDEQFAERFRAEARTMSSLSHDNIASVFACCDAYATIFIVMEHIEGTTLERMIAETGPLPPADARRIIRQLALALGHAHERGIVHRDVKPSNVLIDRTGRVKLVDFGVARSRSEPEEPGAGVDGDAVPVVIGTPEYMSPEQALGRPVDRRSDICSLGLVAYEMLTGRLPYTTTDLRSVIRQRVRDAVGSPRAVVPGTPGDLCEFVRRACAKSPLRRFQECAEIVGFFDRLTPDA